MEHRQPATQEPDIGLGTRLTRAEYDAFKAAARSEHRSMSAQLRVLVIDYLKVTDVQPASAPAEAAA